MLSAAQLKSSVRYTRYSILRRQQGADLCKHVMVIINYENPTGISMSPFDNQVPSPSCDRSRFFYFVFSVSPRRFTPTRERSRKRAKEREQSDDT